MDEAEAARIEAARIGELIRAGVIRLPEGVDYETPRLSSALRTRTPRGDYYSGGVLHVDIPSAPESKTTRDRYGLPEIEPLPESPPAREMYSPTEHLLTGELVQKGMPTRMAKPVDKFINFGRATGNMARGMTGAPMIDWAASRGTDLAEALYDWQPDLPEKAVAAISPRSAVAQTAEQKARSGFDQSAYDRQKQMIDAGYPIKKLDGIWGRETEGIWKQFMADEPKRRAAAQAKEAREQAAAERAAAAATEQANAAASAEAARATAAKAVAEGKEAEARADEIRRKAREQELAAEAEKAKQERRKLGFEELRDAERAHKKTWGYQFEQNAPIIGGGLGVGVAAYAKKKIVDAYNKLRQSQVANSNQLLRSGPADDVGRRVGDLNRFWTEGQKPTGRFANFLKGKDGPLPEEPFKVIQNAPQFVPNMTAPAASQLYRMTPWDRAANIGTDVGAAGAFGAEAALTNYFYTQQAQKEMTAAQAAVNDEPSKANIERLYEAKNALAKAQAIEYFGRVGAASYLGKGVFMKRDDQSRPAVNAAQMRQIELLKEYQRLTKQQRGPGGGAPGAGPGGGGPLPAAPAAAPAAPAAAAPTQMGPGPQGPAGQPPRNGIPAQAAPQPGAKASPTPSDLPDWATKAGITRHPHNPDQVRMPDGSWGPNASNLTRAKLREWQKKSKAKSEAESSASTVTKKDEQTGNAKPAEKEPTREIQINDLGPMRGAGLSGLLRNFA
jgi:hypothetical protein